MRRRRSLRRARSRPRQVPISGTTACSSGTASGRRFRPCDALDFPPVVLRVRSRRRDPAPARFRLSAGHHRGRVVWSRSSLRSCPLSRRSPGPSIGAGGCARARALATRCGRAPTRSGCVTSASSGLCITIASLTTRRPSRMRGRGQAGMTVVQLGTAGALEAPTARAVVLALLWAGRWSVDMARPL